jgi:four helix bundle protein
MSAKTTLQSYRELRVWNRAVDLVELGYGITKKLPADEKYGLTSQIRRAAVSVPANIAEGYGRRRRGDYLQHLSIANGSLKELETHFFICVRLGHLTQADIQPAMELGSEVGKMLGSMIRRLEPEGRFEAGARHPTP